MGDIWESSQSKPVEAAILKTNAAACKPKPRKIPASLKKKIHTGTSTFPYLIYRGEIIILDVAEQVELISRQLLTAKKTLGWDIEWAVTYTTGETARPVSLMQICPDPLETIYLFRIHLSGITPALKDLLMRPDIIKCGCGASLDAQKIQRDFNITMGGVIDLSAEYTNLRLPTSNVKKWSLQALTEAILRCSLRKDQSTRCSNWEASRLSSLQIQYAATDAFASLLIYKRLQMVPVQTHPPGDICDGSAVPSSCPSCVIDEDISTGWIPALEPLRRIQPAKLEVYNSFTKYLSLEVATKGRIQTSTVESYVAEAILAGYAYNWMAFRVDQKIVSEVASIMCTLVGKPLKHTYPSTAVKVENATAPVPDLLHLAATRTDMTFRELKETRIDPLVKIGYGTLRLILAHLSRCNAES